MSGGFPRNVPTALVIDKSYLVGSSPSHITSLCAEYQVLMSEALFFELINGPAKECRDCFRKFPAIENPVEIVTHVGTLLAYERQHGSPASAVLTSMRPMRFRFSPRLAEGTFVLKPEQQAGVQDWLSFVAEMVSGFKERSASTHHWFPQLSGYKPGHPSSAIEKVAQQIAEDEKAVRSIYDSFRPSDYPAGAEIDPNWALFCWTQVQLLYSLEYIRRYGLERPDMLSKEIPRDVVDMQYVITGLLAGALASRDAMIKSVFQQLRPSGWLLS